MPVAIVTDSACDLSPQQAASLGIDLVPIIVRFGSQEYRDGVDLRLADFYRKLDPNGELPMTAPPPPEAFAQVFRKHVNAGSDVICIVVSASLSKIYENAVAAAAEFGPRVNVIDSKTLSGGTGLLTTGAARLAKSGADAQSVAAAIRKWIGSQHGYAIYPDLKFLQKSGRINKAQLLLGTVMHLVPVTRVSAQGTLEGETTVKSWDQAKQMLANIAARKLEHPLTTRVAIAHTNDPELGSYLLEEFRQRLAAPVKELNLLDAGPTIAANAGPGAAAIFMLEE